MLFERIFRELNAKNVKYMVIGGLAVNLHGFARATGDLDIIISFDKENVGNFIEAIKILQYKPRVPVNIEELADQDMRTSWIKEKNMKVFSVFNPQNPMELLDVVLENDIDFETAYQNMELLTAGDIKIPVISIDDLIKLKQIAGRERDNLDIRALKKIKELKDETDG